jgi:hypothetical protein
MRLMLSTANGEPSLLVEVDDNYNPVDFKFWVVSGAWSGRFDNGDITVDGHNENLAVDSGVTITCDTQSRLHGEYHDVFSNFDNVNYVAPEPTYKKSKYDDMDDDIPF